MIISSGVISVRIGMLPDMNTTDPYSPIARAKAMANPAKAAGKMVGNTTWEKVCQRVAPRLAAASSSSFSMSCKNRLNASHYEWQTNKGERDDHAQLGIGSLDSQ